MKNLAVGRSGVKADYCELHGTWFDARELDAVVELLERGGAVKWPPR
jgi:Zn-finger nucleic acid-binding protein